MNLSKTLSVLLTKPVHNFQQVRQKWINHWMIRDVNRRKVIKEFAPTRLRINSLRKNDVLPAEIREIADAEIQALPKSSALMQASKRCVLTSRPRGVVHRWRMSRIVFRHLADYNKLAGVQRAMW